MRTIEAEKITKTVARLCKETNYNLGDDVVRAYKESLAAEDSEVAQEILEHLMENSEIAQ